MTINQLHTLTEDELEMLLYVCNVINPLDVPEIQLTAIQLTWIKHTFLLKKITDSFPKIKNESHAIYKSLLEKLGLHIDIKYEQPPSAPPPPAPEPPIAGHTLPVGENPCGEIPLGPLSEPKV